MRRSQKLAFGSCDFSISLVITLVGVYFAIFLVNTVGMSAGGAAIAIFLGRSWDYINDPLLGYLSDRTRSKWGRRRPFLLFGAIPLGVAFAMMWLVPPFARETWQIVYYATTYLLFDAALTVVYMPFVALTTDLTQDYDERTRLTNYRMAFSIIASLVAFSIPPIFIGPVGPEDVRNFLFLGVIAGGVSILPIFITFIGTRERTEFIEQEPEPFFASLKAAFRNKPFVYSMGIFLLTWVCVDLLLALLLFFIQYGLGRGDQSEMVMGPIFVTALVALPLWSVLAKKFDKRKALMIGLGFWAATQILLITLIPDSSFVNVLVICVLAGIGVSAAHVLPWAIVPDAVEYDEWKTGKRHEGTFFSILTLAQKVASSLAVPGALLVLEIFDWRPGSPPTQPPQALAALRVLVGPVPAVLLGGAIVLALLYPLGRKEFERISRELEARRAGKVVQAVAETSVSGGDDGSEVVAVSAKSRVWIWIAAVIVVIATVLLLGPRPGRTPTIPKEDDTPIEDVIAIEGDVSAYVVAAESWYDDIVPGTEKTIEWAGEPGVRTEVAVVFLHGFSGSRQEMVPAPQLVAEELHANLFLTRYTGHGRGTEAMSVASVKAWFDDTVEALAIGQAIGESVVVIAVSTAAPLVASLDAQGLDADAVIFASPNFGPADEAANLLLLPWGNLIARLVVGKYNEFETVSPEHAHYTTPRFRSRVLVTMMGAVRLSRGDTLPEMSAPVLYLYSENDDVVSIPRIHEAFEQTGSEIKELSPVVSAAGHVPAGNMLSGQSTEEFVGHVVGFVRRVLE